MGKGIEPARRWLFCRGWREGVVSVVVGYVVVAVYILRVDGDGELAFVAVAVLVIFFFW